jgi:hypothetical protein
MTDNPSRFWIQTGLIAAGFILVFFKTIAGLVSDWSTDPNFSHGFLIPVIALYMVWYKKDQLRQIFCWDFWSMWLPISGPNCS